MKSKTDVISKTETHAERPVSLGDRKSYYEGFDNISKTKDIYGLLHHRERTANANLKRPANDHNGGVVSFTIPCNGQLEKDLGNSPAKGPSNANKHESKSWEDNIDVDMVIPDQDYQYIVRKSWQYEPGQFSVIKSLNEKFFDALKSSQNLCLTFKWIFFSRKNLAPWVERFQESQTSVIKSTGGLIKLLESILKVEKQNYVLSTKKILSLAVESVMLLGHTNYCLNNIRREKIKCSLYKDCVKMVILR